MDVKGKVVIVTGSAMGLGKAFAEVLLKEGAKVCISDVNEDIGNKTKEEFEETYGKKNVTFVKCDVTREEQLKNLYDNCEAYFDEKVDIFCGNAGIAPYKAEDWKKTMDIDIIAVMSGTELALERMSIENGGRGGLIVNTASAAGLTHGVVFDRDSYSYPVAKHGVVALTRALGSKAVFSKTGVKVQCICPTFADTAILTPIPDSGRDKIRKLTTLMTPEYVAEAFLLLIKECGNGAAIAVAPNVKPFLYPDNSFITFFFYANLLIKLLQQVVGGKVVKEWHLGLALSALVLLIFFMFHIFLNFMF